MFIPRLARTLVSAHAHAIAAAPAVRLSPQWREDRGSVPSPPGDEITMEIPPSNRHGGVWNLGAFICRQPGLRARGCAVEQVTRQCKGAE